MISMPFYLITSFSVKANLGSVCFHNFAAQTVLLAFQHYIVMLGSAVMIATMLVPRMGGGPGDNARVIQSMLFMSGINTLLQTLFGTRLPTVMGRSFTYFISVLLAINDINDGYFTTEHERFTHTMKAVQGSLIVSSFLNIIIGYGKAWGNLTRFFTPVVLVPVVCVVGLGLFSRGFPQLGNSVEIGLPMLILLVVSQQYLQRIQPTTRPILERFALLVCGDYLGICCYSCCIWCLQQCSGAD
ncbi:hypothetical protein ACH5RR_027279 [Cinchona calisaya]|uniref:Uncharacterized protein n=1 Tax=Cinchona calisaya TaxID=153742 RepID=A0ABD2Z8W5_9GENT